MHKIFSMQKQIEDAIRQSLKNVHLLKVKNKSQDHFGHTGYSKDSHFEILLVTEDFTCKSRLDRHRLVLKILKDIVSKTHSLSFNLLTVKEYQKTINEDK